ncbi:hypothetical protein [Bacillus atrophaeus]|uniref:hypothetical protein n=1 Tax=Bacillus atrophaeus TaxID=1452 RepID=UPI0022811A7D|nr:hypothetical protein [Bacillus atrophaeus]MCY8960080.1 hypothetical protein [Bacillus atrophaeus]MCY8965327.1 hypothetical protein [Bacillus atrophaeus]MCY9439175.1 hypothetical protein [Bacillus atrophaeus]MEC0650096.1 hypothetical protein [Bacillus atrophaeus]
MKVKVNATIITDVDALKADKNLDHFGKYATCETYVVDADSYQLAAEKISKQLKGWHWWCIWSTEPLSRKNNRVFTLYNDELYEKCR